MKTQFNKFMLKKLFMNKKSGFIIPKNTSTVVTTDKRAKTNQILRVLDTCSCDIINSFQKLN